MVFAKGLVFGSGFGPKDVKGGLASANPGAIVQTVNPKAVKNELLLEMLAAQTFRAESSGDLLAKKPEIDLLLRVAGTSQISKAIKTHGAADGKEFLAIVASRNKIVCPNEYTPEEIPRRPLSKSELEKVEKAALLNAQTA